MNFTLGRFVSWQTGQGVGLADQISARYARVYLSDLAVRDLTGTYIHSHAEQSAHLLDSSMLKIITQAKLSSKCLRLPNAVFLC